MSELSRRNETNPIAMVDVYLRNNHVHIHAENLERGGARYFTEVDGHEIHKFKDENVVTKMRLFLYYATVTHSLERALTKAGITLEGLGREAAWNISFAKIPNE